MNKWGFRIAFGLLAGYSILTTVLAYGFAGAYDDLLAADRHLYRVASAEHAAIDACLPDSSSEACHTAVAGFDVVASEKEQ